MRIGERGEFVLSHRKKKVGAYVFSYFTNSQDDTQNAICVTEHRVTSKILRVTPTAHTEEVVLRGQRPSPPPTQTPGLDPHKISTVMAVNASEWLGPSRKFFHY